LLNHFSPGEVVLADRGFCSFADIGLLTQQDVECVFRIFNRKPDYQTGQRLGKYDPLVDWEKPRTCPAGMSPKEYALLPEKLRVREVRIVVEQKGFRSKILDIVTTLLDAKFYTKEAMASLYRRRWSIEIYQPYNLHKSLLAIRRWWRASARYGRRLALTAAVPVRPHRLGSTTADATVG